jgi:hypothetical protein
MTDPNTAAPALGAIRRFLASFDLSVAAHSREELDAGEEAAISAFARGEMDGGGRQALVELLSRNTTALEFLVSLLKR